MARIKGGMNARRNAGDNVPENALHIWRYDILEIFLDSNLDIY